jgi:hypothetical protein
VPVQQVAGDEVIALGVHGFEDSLLGNGGQVEQTGDEGQEKETDD